MAVFYVDKCTSNFILNQSKYKDYFMNKRIFELNSEDVLNMNASLLKEVIKKSEGRSVMAEVCCGHQSFIDSVSNAETASAFGAELITLNIFDMNTFSAFRMSPLSALEHTTYASYSPEFFVILIGILKSLLIFKAVYFSLPNL